MKITQLMQPEKEMWNEQQQQQKIQFQRKIFKKFKF